MKSELENLLDAMATSERSQNWMEGSRLNAAFHQCVVRLSGNSMLMRLSKSLDPLAWLLAPWSIPENPALQPNLVGRHRLLLEALESRDPDRAASAFTDHIVQASPIPGDRLHRVGHAREAGRYARDL
jgi:DNA-binding GntR family transcriptional regulator